MKKSFIPATTIRGGFCIEHASPPGGIVIFGATGDLANRKLFPALLQLYEKQLITKNFFILGCGRSSYGNDSFRTAIKESLPPEISDSITSSFLEHVYYHQLDYKNPLHYNTLEQQAQKLSSKFKTQEHLLFYLATPPQLYAPIVEQLGNSQLVSESENRWRRVLIEKPFGHDLESFERLDQKINQHIDEHQIYRIDHYLGKETVQNILMFRFANAIFEPIWNHHYIDHIQITVSETLGVEHRAGYFEQSGLLRDMFQNHIFQMISLVAMEPPISFDADRIRDEKVNLIRSITPIKEDDVHNIFIRAQYTEGNRGKTKLKAYREETNVDPSSTVETFVAAKLFIENWRWHNVPIFVRAGKRMAQKMSQISIVFKQIPHSMFSPIQAEDFPPNVLTLNIQPNEGISLSISAKKPGPKLCMSNLKMSFTYEDVFEKPMGDAYERLLLDAMLGDQTLFIRKDYNEVSWKLLKPVLYRWYEQNQAPLYSYPANSWGPKEASALLDRAGNRYWV